MNQFLRLNGLGVGVVMAGAFSGCGGGGSDPQPAPPVEVVESAPVVQNGVSCTTAMVPTRDGTRLYTEIYRPVDLATHRHARRVAKDHPARPRGPASGPSASRLQQAQMVVVRPANAMAANHSAASKR